MNNAFNSWSTEQRAHTHNFVQSTLKLWCTPGSTRLVSHQESTKFVPDQTTMQAVTLLSLLALAHRFDCASSFTSERLSSRAEAEAQKSSSFRGVRLATDYEIGESDKDEMTQAFVRYQDDGAKLDVLAAADQVIADDENDNLVVVKMRQDVYEHMKNSGQVEAEIDNKVEAFTDWDEDVPLLSHQRLLAEEIVPWGIKMIQADQLDVGSHDVTVCIIDTGYAEGHPDLPSATGTSSPARNFTWNEDLNGHGTHISGVVAAVGGNNFGVTGAGNIKLHITRGLDQYSSGYESDVRRAVTQCVNAGAKVISISLGSPVMSSTANDLYTQVVEQDGVMIFGAAGNQGGDGKTIHAYPASHPSVISVSAVYEWGTYWENSNYCDQVELAAPGHRILSTSVSTGAVHTSDFSYRGQKVSGAPAIDVSGKLVNCGPGNYQCSEASGEICLMVRDETALESMIANCEDGGGVGAIIFDAVQGSNRVQYRNWKADSNIPAVGVQHLAGIELLKRVDTLVHLGLSNGTDREYSYSYQSGTSMATPHAAAAAALVWSHFPNCTNHQIRHALAVTAQDQGIVGCDWDYGFGIVKAKNAYDFLASHSCTEGDWWQPPTGSEITPVCEYKFSNVLSGQQSSSSPASSENVVPGSANASEQSTATSSARRKQNALLCVLASFLFAMTWMLT